MKKEQHQPSPTLRSALLRLKAQAPSTSMEEWIAKAQALVERQREEAVEGERERLRGKMEVRV